MPDIGSIDNFLNSDLTVTFLAKRLLNAEKTAALVFCCHRSIVSSFRTISHICSVWNTGTILSIVFLIFHIYKNFRFSHLRNPACHGKSSS